MIRQHTLLYLSACLHLTVTSRTLLVLSFCDPRTHHILKSNPFRVDLEFGIKGLGFRV